MREIEAVQTEGLVCWGTVQDGLLMWSCGDPIEVGVLVKEGWVRGWSGQYLTAREPS